MHALNNVLGGPMFQEAHMISAVFAILAETGDDAFEHMRPGGWYSHGVLGMVLTNSNVFQLGSNPVPPHSALLDHPNVRGVVVNYDNVHWVAIRLWQGHLQLLDSQAQAPRRITSEQYSALIHRFPLSFAILDGHIDQEQVQP